MAIEITQEEIVHGLKRIGLKPGMAVEVHSSLRSLGDVQHGPATVIQALIEVVGGDGAIVMSAYPVTLPIWPTEEEKAKGVVCTVRFLDEDDSSQTGMGAVADAFRKWPGVCLGQGKHRLCAWGKDADLHVQGYDYLLSIGGWVLLIGVDIHRCSAMHAAEANAPLPEDIQAYFELPDELQRRYPPEQWYVQYHDPPEDAWGKIQAEAERRGLIRRDKIGQAECLFFEAKPVVDLYEAWLRDDPYALFGFKRNHLPPIASPLSSSEKRAGRLPGERYEFRIKGCLQPDWSDWMEGLAVTPLGNGETLLLGSLPDQAALHGVLAKIRDLNLILISITRK